MKRLIFIVLLFQNLGVYSQDFTIQELIKNKKEVLNQMDMMDSLRLDSTNLNIGEYKLPVYKAVYKNTAIYTNSLLNYKFQQRGFYIETSDAFLYFSFLFQITDNFIPSCYSINVFSKEWKFIKRIIIADNNIMAICNFDDDGKKVSSSWTIPTNKKEIKSIKKVEICNLVSESNTIKTTLYHIQYETKDAILRRILEIW